MTRGGVSWPADASTRPAGPVAARGPPSRGLAPAAAGGRPARPAGGRRAAGAGAGPPAGRAGARRGARPRRRCDAAVPGPACREPPGERGAARRAALAPTRPVGRWSRPVRRGEAITDVRLVGPASLAASARGWSPLRCGSPTPRRSRWSRPATSSTCSPPTRRRRRGATGRGRPLGCVRVAVAVAGSAAGLVDGALLVLATTPPRPRGSPAARSPTGCRSRPCAQ